MHPGRQYSSAIIIPGPGAGQLDTIPIAQSHSKLFKVAILNCPALPFPKKLPPHPCKRFGLNLPLGPVLCLLTTLVALPHDPMSHAVPSGSKTCKSNKLCLPQPFHLSPLMDTPDCLIKEYKIKYIQYVLCFLLFFLKLITLIRVVLTRWFCKNH